jgi:prepilin-type N-terminal cleavage/methylation domain-containing protein
MRPAATTARRDSGDVADLRGQSGLTLIELLVSIIIASIISSMLLISWFSLNRSYAYTVSSTKAREGGRQAVSRLQREVRDAESVPGNYTQLPPLQFDLKIEPMILRSRPWTLVFTTTFNEVGNQSPTKAPHLVCYRVYYDKVADNAELWRFEDLPTAGFPNGDGRITGLTFYGADEPLTATGRPDFPNAAAEKASGEGGLRVIKSVVNTDSALASPVSAFSYAGYFDSSTGTLSWQDDVRGADVRRQIISVRIHLLIDVNPRRSPVFADLLTNAQLRNARQF